MPKFTRSFSRGLYLCEGFSCKSHYGRLWLPSVRAYSHSSQAKVNDLDLVGESAHTEDVFWLELIRKHNIIKKWMEG